MKKSNKVLLGTAVMLSLGTYTSIFAQAKAEVQSTEVIEEISLPDVSTVISGGAPKVGKSAVPDYSVVLPELAKDMDDEIIPQLPDSIQSDAESTKADAIGGKTVSKNVYVEGLAGGGYPGFYTGNFSVYRQSGNNPFKITFGHESANGYATHAVTDGYFEKNTDIGAEKTFTVKNHKIVVGVNYESNDNGLQNQAEGISDLSQEELALYTNYNWKIPHGMNLMFGFDGNWYKRYETVTGSVSPESWAKDVMLLDVSPVLKFDFNYKGFGTGLSAEYSLQSDLRKDLEISDSVNRGQFMYNIGWGNETVHLYGNVGIVVGNYIGQNPVQVPFNAGIDLAFKTDISARKISVSLKGGMDSSETKISELERMYLFTAFNVLPGETSDWFGKLDFTLPIKDVFTLDLNGEFKTTAFGNGTYVPMYDSTLTYGVYSYEKTETTQVNTNVDFSARIGIANVSANWQAHWADVPSLCSPHTVGLKASLQDKLARWGGDLGFAMGFGGSDYVPEIDLSFFYRLTPSVRLAISADDVVKLVSGTQRVYAGNYISRSGSATVLVKFFF